MKNITNIKYSSTCKLNIKYIDVLKSTSKSFIDFILYLSQYQDDLGRCIGIYYKDIVDNINICNQSFYNYLRLAEKLNILTVSWINQNTFEWEVYFNDNIFSSSDSSNKRYLNTNFNFLLTQEFKALKKNIKILILSLLTVKNINKGKLMKIRYDKLLNYVGLNNKELLLEYLSNISCFFNINYYDEYVMIGLLCESNKNNSASSIHSYHVLKFLCRKYKATDSYNTNDFKNVVNMISKYKKNYYNLVIYSIRMTLIKYRCISYEYIDFKLKSIFIKNKYAFP